MIEVVAGLKQHFDGLQDRFLCFAELGFQSKGWFKGELLAQLLQLRKVGLVEDLAREVRVSTSRVDVSLRLRGT